MILKNNHYIAVTLSALILLTIPACWPFGKKVGEEKAKFYLVNVLDKNSFDDCRIKGSVNVPFEDVEKFAHTLDKDAEVVFYCANYMCSASGASAEKLKQMGFEKVWAYEGGTAEWYQQGLKEAEKFPIQGVCKASYLTAPNQKHEGETNIPVISVEELREKMKKYGILTQ